MYGVRDFLQEQTKQQNQDVKKKSVRNDENDIFCATHVEMKLKYWCKNCEELICADCIDSLKHENHDFVNFRPNAQKILQSFMEKRCELKDKKLEKLEEKISASQTLIKSYNEVLGAKTYMEASRDLLTRKWEKLEQFASGSNRCLDMTLMKWFFDRDSFDQHDIPELPIDKLVHCETQTETNKLDKEMQTISTKSKNKRTGPDQKVSVTFIDKSIQVELDEEDFADETASEIISDVQSEQNETLSDHAPSADLKVHFCHEQIQVNDRQFQTFHINFPFIEKFYSAVWSDYIECSKGRFRLGVQNVYGTLDVFFDTLHLKVGTKYSVSFSRYTGYEGNYYIWKTFNVRKAKNAQSYMCRSTWIPINEFYDKNTAKILSRVTFFDGN